MKLFIRSPRHPVTPSPDHPTTLSPGSLRVWIVTASAGLSLLGVLVAGKITRAAVQDWDHYTVAFAEIDCTLPPGQERSDFLAEVQYLAGMPDRTSLLEENLAARIADAFARHPWVEQVEKVALLPTRQVKVQLRFRVPLGEPSVATAR